MKNPTDVQQVEAMSLALIVYKLLFFSRQSLHSAKCPADNPGNPFSPQTATTSSRMRFPTYGRRVFFMTRSTLMPTCSLR